MLSQQGVDGAKAASIKAKAALEAAREAYQLAKARRDGGGEPAAAPSAAAAGAGAGTSRQQGIKAAQEAEKAARAEQKQLAKRQAAARRSLELQERLRIMSVGKDRHGARYWMLPELTAAPAEEDDEADEADEAEVAAEAPRVCRLLVEAADGAAWGEVAELDALTRALKASDDKADKQLLLALRRAPPLAPISPERLAAAAAAGVAVGGGGAGDRPAVEREPDSSDEEEEALQIAAAQRAAQQQVALAAAAVDAAGVRLEGHAWLGQRVRQLLPDDEVADGTVTGWLPATEAPPSAGDAGCGADGGSADRGGAEPMGEEGSEEVVVLDDNSSEEPSQAGLGAAAPGARTGEAQWRVARDDGEIVMLGAAEVEAALEEARRAPFRALQRQLLSAEEEARDEFTHWRVESAAEAEAPWQPDVLPLRAAAAADDDDDDDEVIAMDEDGAADDAAQRREAWVKRVQGAVDATGLRAALLQLAKAAPPAADAPAAQWRRDWQRRLHESATVAQLAVRGRLRTDLSPPSRPLAVAPLPTALAPPLPAPASPGAAA